MVVERSCGGGEGEGGEGDLDEVVGALSGYLDEYWISVVRVVRWIDMDIEPKVVTGRA